MTALPKAPGFGLGGRRALVTGASRGIGLACAAALAGEGAHVGLVGRSGGDLAALAAAIREDGGSAEAIVLDVTDRAAVDQALAARPAFDILVNNAGMNRPRAFVAVSEDDVEAIFGLNVKAAFFVAQSVTRRLLSAGRPGSIINMSSQMGHVGAADRSVYCASKHALEGLTKAMAVELGPHGIRVNTVCPTFIETPMTQAYFRDAAFRQSVLAKIKLGRLGGVEDVMGAVIYLASEASSMVTGTALRIDGGWTAD